ncbi:S8 family peptidase [Burkholderia multivorans]|uniref:Subtilase n=1 Tax=Burkholderia multivorans TaxID=87883 RepID=A0A2S9M6C7_9BURK|nr:S8 family peptidase [Burkholderia multivorans]MBU9147135.1 S8 family peptidase [Burkholderia multivorans]MBU9515919.1 S8 family peptidase [Burkholderia multivorans]MBU9528170.1 S8 family peptidase [Burkholderia multivorans]MBU9540986.1 S8 family peptidase [Burkholderia multivorans]MBU9639322.1 S8 family peptidase [Burkholderia multivorans]
MPDWKRHIFLDGFNSNEEFRSRRTGRNPVIPPQDRFRHGAALTERYTAILGEFDHRRQEIENPITEDTGVFIEITSAPGVKLPLDSLDTRDFKLHACKEVGDAEVAVIFVPESRRDVFLRKLTQYLDPEKDSGSGPRNHNLIDSIAEMRLADLRTFWTDDARLFPQDTNQTIWWELWLKKRADENQQDLARQLADRIGGQLGTTSLSFFDSMVFLIKASASQLERAPELIASLEELRRAKETPNVIIDSSPKEQQQWAEDILRRLQMDGDASTAVTILDTGVNYNHPILSAVTTSDEALAWDPAWPHFDPANDHGSRQAGLAAFGDLHDALVSAAPIVLTHRVESGRILPQEGENDPELYGAITVNTAAALEERRPDWNRVYSLAITADSDSEGGLPTSWSAEIDKFTSGAEDGRQRLFVVSAGNNRAISPDVGTWEQLELAEIEDPAQAWNALTVGAYTEKTTNDDPDFDGWSPFARAGDAAPSSRSSVNWGWRRQAPYKPDVVAEGGNRLLSPDATEVTDADVVSLLTTSGRTAGQLFEVTADTSAACALVSRQAAMLTAEYPSYWPETIRGLLAHSADWTDRMWERFGLLNARHSPKVAKETMLRCVGYGVTNLERARYSANHALTLVAQDTLRPFTKAEDASASTDPKLNEMQLYRLPWPVDALRQLPPELEVSLRVTLSYFIEPNPGRRGYRQRYSYQSHGLRFEVIRPNQSLDNFRAFINAKAELEDYDGPEGDADGWRLGPQLRTRGSLHSDVWTGPAAALADMDTIAVYPVGGWWKYRTAHERWRNDVRYSLIVSIDVPDESVDIYTVVSNLVETEIET